MDLDLNLSISESEDLDLDLEEEDSDLDLPPWDLTTSLTVVRQHFSERVNRWNALDDDE